MFRSLTHFEFISVYGVKKCYATAAKSLQSCPTLCNPIDSSPPGSPVPGILQARTLEWVAISFSNVWKWKSESEVVQSCLTLSDPMDCSLPGFSAHGIFQARVLEWCAIAVSTEWERRHQRHLPMFKVVIYLNQWIHVLSAFGIQTCNQHYCPITLTHLFLHPVK